MIGQLLQDIPVALLWGVIGAGIFGVLGLVSGTDETATITPITLLVVLLNVPPVGVLSFFVAAVVSKHLTHAIPTTLLGIPGDTMAIPLLEEADQLRRMGVPHIALRKTISGGIIAALIAIPVSVAVAGLLSPLAGPVTTAAPWIFLVATILIAYFSPAKIGGVVALVPFVLLILALKSFTGIHDVSLTISYFLGIAVGPLVVNLFYVLTPGGRAASRREGLETYNLSEPKSGSGRYLPNPFKVLDKRQVGWTTTAAAISSTTFVFSPIAMTVIMGELFKKFPKNAYHRLTSTIAVKNGTTESTYLGETLIPLVAFGLPLSPMSAQCRVA